MYDITVFNSNHFLDASDVQNKQVNKPALTQLFSSTFFASDRLPRFGLKPPLSNDLDKRRLRFLVDDKPPNFFSPFLAAGQHVSKMLNFETPSTDSASPKILIWVIYLIALRGVQPLKFKAQLGA